MFALPSLASAAGGGVKAVQSGSFTSSNTGADVDLTISRIIPGKSFCLLNAVSSATTAPGVSIYIKNSTTLTIRDAGTGSPKVDWQVVEFN